MPSIDELCQQFVAVIAGKGSLNDRLSAAAMVLAQIFSVRQDDVAIFLFDPDQEMLRFAWPPHMRTAGSFPISARNSLAAATCRSRQPMLDNSFATTPHLFVFESVRPDLDVPYPIQKIMSVPVVADDRLMGAIQVSRKGPDMDAAGTDFSEQQLQALHLLAEILAQHLPVATVKSSKSVGVFSE